MRGYMKLRMPWGAADQAQSAADSKKTGAASQTARPSGWLNAGVNRQIRSFVPGQTIRGEVLSRNGSDVQIRLSEDLVVQAKIDQNMNLEVGKSMTFEVRNNGSALTLSPLFENMSADVNVLKALEMAGLPVNETSVSMTRQLMEAGLPVERNALQQVYREVVSYPQAEVSDVVNLHKLGLPVNEANVSQMMSYRNLTHQLLDGMESVLGALPDALEGMAREGNLQGLTGLYQELFALAREGAGEALPQLAEGEMAASGTAVRQEAEAPPSQQAAAGTGPGGQVLAAPPDGGQAQASAGLGGMAGPAAGILAEESKGWGETAGKAPDGAIQEGIPAADILPAEGETAGAAAALGQQAPEAEILSAASRQAISGQLFRMLQELLPDGEEARQLAEQIRQFGQGNGDAGQLFETAGKLLQAARTAEGGIQRLHRIFSGEAFRELLSETLKQRWMLRPEELAENGKVEELYRRMDRQLKTLSHALESGGQADSAAFRAASAMSQNIDFMNQLNQLYTYVQLPMHLLQGDAQGELYVYANKKNLAENDGKISALLHLDMEHLGPVDVYVMLEQAKVNTRFYVRDDEMLDFLADHMPILTKRLKERGYDCSFSMTAREEGKEEGPNSGIGPILEQEKGVLITQYAFDVRT